jgi:hypothetical protein
VVTGAGANVILRFDDEQQVVIGPGTEFRIVDFQYSKAAPQTNRGVFDLLRGALRVVTGAVASTNRAGWALRTPQMTIGVRGTDFMVLTANQGYVSVTQGAIAVSNGAGTVVFGAGSAGAVASSSALAASVPVSSLPTAASGAFSSLAAAPVGAAPGGTAAGAGAAGGGGGNATTTHH